MAQRRLQIMRVRIHKYNIDLLFKVGKELLLADTLSIAQLPEINETYFGVVTIQTDEVMPA